MTITSGTTTIIVAPIKPRQGENQRAAERRCAAQVVADALGAEVVIDHRPDGAPFITGREDLHISISHSRHLVAVAIDASRRIGIDIEEPRPRQLERVAERFLTPAEHAVYGTDDEALLLAWTKKEAAYKIAPYADLRLIAIDDNPAIEFPLSTVVDGARLTLAVAR